MSSSLLRPGLLRGVRFVVAGDGPLGAAAGDVARGLGADVRSLAVDVGAVDEPPTEGFEDAGRLVWDGAGAFAAAGGASVEAVRAALDGAWLAVRPLANVAWIGPGRPGRVVLLAPRPGDAHAAAARAGLENLARTLSIEWARHGIRIVTILPGAASAAQDVAQLCAFLASPAGDYHSGSVLAMA